MKKVLANLILVATALFATVLPAHAVQSVTADANGSADGKANGAHFTGDFTLSLADNENIADGDANTIAVTTATHNTGSLSFAGTSTVTGVVGSSSSVQIKQIFGGSAADESVTFANNVFAVTSTVGSTGTLLFNGNLTGTTVNFNGDGRVVMADDKDLTAAITTATNNTGSLSLAGTSTVSGQVGVSGTALKQISAGAAGNAATFSSDVFATTTTVTSTGTINLNGNLTGTTLGFNGDGTVNVADGKSISAAITTATNNTGSVTFAGASTIASAVGSVAGNDLKAVNINGGIVTLSSATDYAVTTTTVNSGGTLKIGAAQTITGAVTLAGTGIMDLGANTTTVTGVYTQAAGTTLRTTISNSTTLGNIVATTVAPAVAAASTVDVVVAGYIPNSTAYTLIDAGAAGINAPTTITDNSAALSFATSVAANDLILTATRSYTGLTTDANAGAVANTLSGFSTGATGDMSSVISQLDQLGTSSAFDAAVEQLDPDVSGGTNQAGFNTAQGIANTIATRMSNARSGANSGSGQAGMALGDESVGAGIWFQGFGGYGDQDDVDGVSGYEASTYGGSSGLDWVMGDNGRLGFGFAYGKSNIDTKDSLSESDVDSYQGSVYGGVDNENYYLDGLFSMGWNTYDASRKIEFGSINREALADYDGQQYTAKASFGYYIPSGSWKVIPTASLLYSHLSLDDYEETGASSLNLIVDEQDYDFLQLGLGGKLQTTIVDDKKQKWIPAVHAQWLYDFIGDEASTEASFSGGGVKFATNGIEPEQSQLNAGAALTVYTNDSTSVSLAYDFDVRSDYTGHGGSATMRYEF